MKISDFHDLSRETKFIKLFSHILNETQIDRPNIHKRDAVKYANYTKALCASCDTREIG